MNIKTITTIGGVNEVDFGSNASRFYWFQNIGTTAVHVSGKADITAGSDGVAELAAGDSVCIETLGGKVYVLGAGKVQIHNTGDKFCPFKNAPAQSGGGTIDAYSKTESDAKYAQKTDIPSSLPANGGNADTVGGKSASDFVGALTFDQIDNTRTLIPDNVDVIDWLIKNAKIGNLYLVQAGSTGQTNLPPLTGRGWAWFSYDGNRYFCRVMLSEYKTIDYMLDYVNYFGGWKEISTTPIKKMTFPNVAIYEGGGGTLFSIDYGTPIAIACTSRRATQCTQFVADDTWYVLAKDAVTLDPIPAGSYSFDVWYI